MTTSPTIRILVWCLAAGAAIAAGTGVLSRGGPGPWEHVSVRGEVVPIHGTGVYRDMSAEVAPQGMAQDVVTLVVAIPLLLLALRSAARGSVSGAFLLAGTLGYFFVTYLFYLMMGTYNALFLLWVFLLATSFFSLAGVMLRFDVATAPELFTERMPARGAGVFLMATSLMIALLWLGIIVPPLITGAIVPPQVEHYTTLVVQGLDLALLLPIAGLSGWLLLKRRPLGYVLAPTYLVFLVLLMTALTAKVLAMGMLGYNIIPAVVIIPATNALAVVMAVRVLSSTRIPLATRHSPNVLAPAQRSQTVVTACS